MATLVGLGGAGATALVVAAVAGALAAAADDGGAVADGPPTAWLVLEQPAINMTEDIAAV